MTQPYEAVTYDWHVEDGDCLSMGHGFKQSDDTPFDLTGYGVRVELRWRGNILILSSEDSPATLDIDAAAGTVVASLTKAQTEALPFGATTKIDWVLVEPDGCEFTPVKGHVVKH